jgi:hypothetical protein
MDANKGKLASIAVTGCLTACVAISGPEKPISSPPYSQRLVIQFKSDRQACDAAGIAALSRMTGVSLAVVRPTGKGGCIVNQFASHPDDFLKQQNRIEAHDSIQWAEPDQRMRAY